MKNKKTSYIWILIVLEIINIPLVIMSLLDRSYTGNLALWYIASALNLIGNVYDLRKKE